MTFKSCAVWLVVAAYCWQVGLAQVGDSDEDPLEGYRKCEGGYCVALHLCRNNTIVQDGEGVIETALRFDVDINKDPLEECEEFMLKCCRHQAHKPPRTAATTKKPPPPEDTTSLPEPSCGVGHPQGFMYYVKNDSFAQYAEFPWMAGLYSGQGAEAKYFCGGSLIHPQMVMTAAHCLTNISAPEQLTVRLGDWDAVFANEPHKHQDIVARKIIVHEQFNRRNFQNDVALVVLSVPATLGVHINSICLPEPGDSFDRQRCVTTGWGKSPRDNKFNELQKRVQLPVVERRQCQRMLRQTVLGPLFLLHRSFMCAGAEEGVDTCQGDGGAPLMCQKPGSEGYVQAGIVAWGIGCGVKDVPGVYVNVASFVEWIEGQMLEEGLGKNPQAL